MHKMSIMAKWYVVRLVIILSVGISDTKNYEP